MALWHEYNLFLESYLFVVHSMNMLLPYPRMVKDIIHVLEAVGLDNKQSQLYIAGLQSGTAPASDYAKATGINRITAYNLLEEMVHRGYFTMTRKVRSKWYAPVAPEYIALEAKKNAEALSRALPELRSLQGSTYRSPRVRFFE